MEKNNLNVKFNLNKNKKRSNYFSIKKYLKLSTKKVVLLGVFVALYVIFGVISWATPFIWPGSGFLKFEFTYIIILMATNFFNFFYVFMLIIICNFLRIPDSVFPVSTISLMLVDITLIIWMYVFSFVLSLLKIKNLLKYVLLGIMITIFSSFTLCLINKIFLLNLYVIFFPSFSSLLPTLTSNLSIWGMFLPFNLVNLGISVTLFVFCMYILSHSKINKESKNISKNIIDEKIL